MPRTTSPAVDALSQDLAVVLAERSCGAGYAPADLDVAADVVVEHLHHRGLITGMSRATMVRGLTGFLTHRSTARGFDFVDLDVAAEVALEWFTNHGLLTLDDLPATVLVLTEQWPGTPAVTSVHVSLVDAQIAARAVVAARGRAVPVGVDWEPSTDTTGRAWSWAPVLEGVPVGHFTITESPLS